MLAAHPSVPANNFAEFVTWAKANRGKLSYSSYTPGTPSHFLGFQLNEKFDLDLTHVPYRGSGLQTNGLIAGHTLFGFSQVNTTAPQYAAGKLKAFGITSAAPLAVDAGRADLRRTRSAGVHDARLVRPAGQRRHAARYRDPPDRRGEGGAQRPRSAQQARGSGL